ncbi:uncharacterized protein LOC129735969 [Falco cherrug]|uniref:uncharacterized protein LOC129735969 n=1 Tax=Falco cherrug TaxID=345164 RepID=UPI00247A5323|nr:uncharacterized protein LOC129735969 [Falco cherrug]
MLSKHFGSRLAGETADGGGGRRLHRELFAYTAAAWPANPIPPALLRNNGGAQGGTGVHSPCVTHHWACSWPPNTRQAAAGACQGVTFLPSTRTCPTHPPPQSLGDPMVLPGTWSGVRGAGGMSWGGCWGSLGTMLSLGAPTWTGQLIQDPLSEISWGGHKLCCTCCIYFTYRYKYTLIFLICIPCQRSTPMQREMLFAEGGGHLREGSGGSPVILVPQPGKGWGWRRDGTAVAAPRGLLMSLAPMSGFGQVLCAGASCWNQGGGWLAPVAQQSGGVRPPPVHSSAPCPQSPPVPSTLALPAQPPWGRTPAPLLPASNSPLHHYPYWCLLTAILSVQPRQRAAFIPPSSPSPALLLQLFLTCLPGIAAAGPRYDPARSCHPISPDFSWGVFKDPQDFKGGTLSRHPSARDRAGTQPGHPPTDSPSLPFSRLINSRAGKRQGTSQRGSPSN